MKFFISIFLLVVCFFSVGFSQADVKVNEDLSQEGFMAIVKKFHPVIKQADLQVKMATANITVARGGFDPSFYLETHQKTLDGKNYYSYVNPELKIPSWYGIEIKAGLENNGGVNLNSEESFGKTSYVGISVPLAKNLLMDKRRAVLQQAKIFSTQSLVERQNTVNDLLYDANTAYWNWVKEYQVYDIITQAIKINEARFELVKIGYRQGDRSAIDTIEALVQLQQFQFLQNESWVRLSNAALDVSGFLWQDNNTYYQLDEKVIPAVGWDKEPIENMANPVLEELLYSAKINHPKLQLYKYKLQILDVERRLKFQSLLPTVNVKGTLLNKDYNVFKGVNPAFFENNNKFGISIGLPLRLSEGRGGYQLAKLKIQETNFDLMMKQQEVENKIKYYFNEMVGLQNQVKIYELANKNYQSLLRGEDTRFRSGESTLFLLNSRENKVLESNQKLAELKTKFYKSKAALLWAAGLLRKPISSIIYA